MSAEELKRYVPGSVLEMNDNTFGFTPLKRAVVVSASGDIQVSFKAHGQAAGVLHPLPWWGQNVKRLVPGVLTGNNAVGSAAAGLAIGGARATLRVANGDPFAELLVSAVGGGEQSTPITTALQAVGATGWRAWLGGEQLPPLRAGGGIPTLADCRANAAVVPAPGTTTLSLCQLRCTRKRVA